MIASEETPMRITIDLRRDEYDRLSAIAKSERRPLRDQAAWLVSQALTPKNQEVQMS